ncbi:hypothetical protein CJ030_MR5G004852 [Morella rubra]|uniref:Uncharacterized protein n=1 Tax=Morella rubra TaxID=262757 RepID=A0A6A1VLD3_9ROSI|nr:hypothetical protein CJ030_MR5G004852 [Morella rubra]
MLLKRITPLPYQCHNNTAQQVSHGANTFGSGPFILETSDYNRSIRKVRIDRGHTSTREFDFLGSCNGLLLLSRCRTPPDLFIWNPCSGKKKKVSCPDRFVLEHQGANVNGVPHWLFSKKDSIDNMSIAYFDPAEEKFRKLSLPADRKAIFDTISLGALGGCLSVTYVSLAVGGLIMSETWAMQLTFKTTLGTMAKYLGLTVLLLVYGDEKLDPKCNCCLAPKNCTLHLADGTSVHC